MSRYSKSHYVLVAQIISTIENLDERKSICQENIVIFKSDNNNFNESKFKEACNIR